MKHMTRSKTTTDTPSSMTEFEMLEFEKLGINRKFLETETGRAIAHALSIIQAHAGYTPDDETVAEDIPVEHPEGATYILDVKD